ncbi:medium-chain fatty acid-CoA ligase faa2, partial [Linderina macrospora]
MILHRNLEFVQKSLKALFDIDGEVVALSYLPLAHIYERFVEIFIMSVGGQIGFFSNILNVVADMQTLKPSMFMSVPRLLNRIFDSVAAITIYAPGIRGAIARRAVADKVANMQAGKGNTHTVWDRVVFKKVRDILGGNVQLINTGSAPIEKKVLEFLRVAFCCHVSEGWGQTESTGYGIVTVKGETVGLRVGIPQYGVEVKLMDIPDMDYLVTDKPFPRGELMVRGGLVFGGYYKDQEKTDQTILEGGWLATGDVAQFNADGTISIIDRKKSIFKLSQGEYIAPENLENIFTNNLLILQMFVHGDSLQSTLVSVIVPDPDKFVPWARKIIGNNGASFEELCKSLQVTTAMHKVIMEDAKRAKLQGYEIPKALKLEHRPFDIEGNQILTPTFKLKRNVAAEYYRKDIDQ